MHYSLDLLSSLPDYFLNNNSLFHQQFQTPFDWVEALEDAHYLLLVVHGRQLWKHSLSLHC